MWGKKPTGCLLGACSGQPPVGSTVSPYSPCCFQEYVVKIKHCFPGKFRLIL